MEQDVLNRFYKTLMEWILVQDIVLAFLLRQKRYSLINLHNYLKPRGVYHHNKFRTRGECHTHTDLSLPSLRTYLWSVSHSIFSRGHYPGFRRTNLRISAHKSQIPLI
ncbi:unknown protein [Desulfotalea psychrophila LSv54]|uniref:Uncharacterized protein n=1 Tax=Desulfotalea psychrophila (strain LSv54 / DSM 12343) TaxID=177439 RepID=Q6ANZ1_DESPS|nr:unknown protein [Desulfotalea psychrophila LSv54]